MMSPVDVSVEVSYDNLFFIVIDSIYYNLGDTFEALVNFILRICVNWHIDYMYLCIPYFDSYTPSLFN